MFATLLVASVSTAAQANDVILRFSEGYPLVTWAENEGPAGRLYSGPYPNGYALVDVQGPPLVVEANVAWYFTADFVPGTARRLGQGVKTARFNNGNFAYIGIAGNILSGTFTKGTLTSLNTFLFFSVGGNGIQYTGGSALDPSGGTRGNMSLVISDTGLGMGGFGIQGRNISNTHFTGMALGALDQDAVPEPDAWAALGMLASGLTGLVLRSRRRPG